MDPKVILPPFQNDSYVLGLCGLKVIFRTCSTKLHTLHSSH
jgi:hypothetical protein